MTLLMLLSALLVLLLLGTLAYALVGIARVLDVVGGSPTSYLAKLRLGLRAIERETSHLPATAPKINAGLGNIANGLKQVDTTLGGLHAALKAQERSP